MKTFADFGNVPANVLINNNTNLFIIVFSPAYLCTTNLRNNQFLPLYIDINTIMKNQILPYSYDRSNLSTGILHIGVGNFHRAHEEFYTNLLLADPSQNGWAICGAMLMP